jgi:1,2-diacylglycerol 3-alpha-glucosyltransferase
MKIALFTNTYPPSLNGVANCTHLYRRGLQELGHEVYVFSPEPADDDPFEADPFVHRYPSFRAPGELDYMLALPLPFSLKVFTKLLNLEVDLVHTQHPAWVGKWGQTHARRNRVPLVSTAHAEYELFADRVLLPGPWVAPFVTRRVVKYYNRCQAVTTPVNSTRQRLQESGVASAIVLLPNPVDLSGLAEPHGATVRKRLGIGEGDIVIGYLGRLSEEKNLHCVLQAARLLSRGRPNVHLLFVGGGPEEEKLRRRARWERMDGRVTFAGTVPHERVHHYHDAMDLFLTASKSETQPLAYTEAMYVGTPVVALRTPGAQDMIQDGVNGLLVEPNGGAEGLAAAAERLLADEALRRKVREGGRVFAESCSYQAVAQRLEQVYHQAQERYTAQRASA